MSECCLLNIKLNGLDVVCNINEFGILKCKNPLKCSSSTCKGGIIKCDLSKLYVHFPANGISAQYLGNLSSDITNYEKNGRVFYFSCNKCSLNYCHNCGLNMDKL